MAIKFRCRHCGQFLGISLARAGNIVDCPSCGRQLRVPDLDGRIRPLPSPQLDLDDSGLVRALGEVAKIGKPPSTEEMDVRAVLERVSEGIVEPVPLPEPIPVDPPLPAEIAAAPTAVSLDDIQDAPRPAARVHNDPFAELARLAEEEPVTRRRSVARRDHWKELKEQLATPTVLVTLLISTLIALCAGILIGRATAPSAQPAPLAAPNNAANPVAAQAAPEPAAAPRAEPLRGRVTVKNQSGDSASDVGAKIIVFPINAVGDAKLPVAGITAAATDAEVQAARDALRKLGGEVAVANATGEFSLSLPAGGTYPVLVLSRSLKRDANKAIDPTLKEFLEGRVDKPEELLGDVRYHFSRVAYHGEGRETWEFSFEGK